MKRLLIVVDYQNDFVDGALGFEGAELLDERIAKKIDEYRDAADHIAFTCVNLPIPHCIEGTDGHELYGQVATRLHDSDDVFLKPTFGSTALFERLMKRQAVAERIGAAPFESIELVGLVSNMCVLSNAVIARTACPNVPIIVDAACTAAPDPIMNEKAFDIMEGLQIRVINRDQATQVEEADEAEESGEVEEAEADDLAPEVEESEAEEPASEVETSELAE